MKLAPAQLLEADAVRPKTEARMRPGGGAEALRSAKAMTLRSESGRHRKYLSANVARQTAVTTGAAPLLRK